MTEARCKTCRYFTLFNDRPGAERGWCLRFPPRVLWYDDALHSAAPKVSTDYWCGEWAEQRNGQIENLPERLK